MTTKGNREFTHYTIEEFNKRYGIKITSSMNLEELTDHIEENEISYLYASYNDEDVLNEVKICEEELDRTFELVCIESSYLALL